MSDDLAAWVQAGSAVVTVGVLVLYQLRNQRTYEEDIKTIHENNTKVINQSATHQRALVAQLSAVAFGRHSLELLIEFSKSYISVMDDYYDLFDIHGGASQAQLLSRSPISKSRIERWHRRFWDLQFHQFQAWVDGYIRDDLMEHWANSRLVDFRRSEIFNVQDIAYPDGFSFVNGWDSIKRQYQTAHSYTLSKKFFDEIEKISNSSTGGAAYIDFNSLKVAKEQILALR